MNKNTYTEVSGIEGPLEEPHLNINLFLKNKDLELERGLSSYEDLLL